MDGVLGQLAVCGALFFVGLLILTAVSEPPDPTPAELKQQRYEEQRLALEGRDRLWEAKLRKEKYRVLQLFKNGHVDEPFTVTDWEVPTGADDHLKKSPSSDTLHEISRQRRFEWYLAALAEVDQVRWRKRREIEAESRREQQRQEERQQAERERQRQAQQAAERAEAQRRMAEQEAAERARRERINRKVLRPWPLQAGAGRHGITLGTSVADGHDLIVPLKQLQHMLVVGATGAGKSVFVHQLVFQLVQRSPDVERVVIFDLKGGVEFSRYRHSGRVSLVWEFNAVAAELAALNQLMLEREAYMRDQDLQNWPGPRVFIVIDEYAEIQSEIDGAATKEEKALARQVSVTLVRIGRRARALGITLVCALQKATTDAMDSALRANLNCRVCLRVNSRQFAASVLDDLDDLPVDPLDLKPGHFIYYDAARGTLDYAVAQIAPGVSLSDQ